jgi:hypothetical protein
MPTKKKMPASLREEYATVKRAYHRAGKAAMGKPKTSTAQKDYQALKGHYRKVLRKVCKATGRKFTSPKR